MLHIVNKSPYERNSLESCLRLASKGSAVLLIEDGVYGATKGGNFEGKVLAAMAITRRPESIPHEIYSKRAGIRKRGTDGIGP